MTTNPHRNDKKPKVSYEECDRLVKAYRDDHCELAAGHLLDAFEGYLVKYYNVIRWGKVAIQDRDIREFVKLYMRNEYCRRHIHQYRRMPVVQQEIYNVTQSIRRLCFPYANDELMNEIYVALLTMAKRYKSPDGKPRFHSYVLQAFHYQLRRQLQTLVSDPIVFKMAHNINFHDEFHEGTNDYDMKGYNVEKYEDKTERFTIHQAFESINDNWILGHTTGDEYIQLTVMERKIIKLYYLDKMSDQQIADRLGTCRATVNRRRNKAVNSLKKGMIKKRRLRSDGDE
jgi:RNA polymerase sigma factor (sigma-70 family)